MKCPDCEGSGRVLGRAEWAKKKPCRNCKGRGAIEWRYPTAFSCWEDGEQEAIKRVVKSGRFTMGDEVRAFEREFAAFHSRAHGIMVNSGSSANLVATAALFHHPERPLKAGQKALVPALAWPTTYAPLVQHGLELAVAAGGGSWNVELAAPGFDPEDAALVVACSILGNPADLAGLKSAASVLDAWLLEDNCESLGALTDDGRLCGTFGDLSTFSFFWSHQVSAIEGGMILTDDDELAVLCRIIRAHGWTRDVRIPESFDEEYSFVLHGYNVRPLELHAAIALVQLCKLPHFIEERRRNVGRFWQMIGGFPGIEPPDLRRFPSPFGVHFTLADASRRNALVSALRGAGIDCRLPTGGSLGLHPYGAPWASYRTPRADAIHRAGLFLGCAPFDISDRLEEAARIIKETLA
jgi:CDP-6-deoxy-D-xylo-4-hexulose-3-dehydrase